MRRAEYGTWSHLAVRTFSRTSSSAVAERPHDASCYWIFCQVTQDRSKWHPWVGCVWVPISTLYSIVTMSISYRFWDTSSNGVTLKSGLAVTSFKVIENGTTDNQWLKCDWTHGNAVPLPEIIAILYRKLHKNARGDPQPPVSGPKADYRSLASDFPL